MQYPVRDWGISNDELPSLTVISYAGAEDFVHGEQIWGVPILLLVMGSNDSSSCCLRSSYSARVSSSLELVSS